MFLEAEEYAVLVGYQAMPAEPGLPATPEKLITVVPEHLTDLSADTARPHQRRTYFIPTNPVTGIAQPKRGDLITEAGIVFTVFDVKQDETGIMQVFARIGQESA